MFSYSGVKDTNVLTFNINSEKVAGAYRFEMFVLCGHFNCFCLF